VTPLPLVKGCLPAVLSTISGHEHTFMIEPLVGHINHDWFPISPYGLKLKVDDPLTAIELMAEHFHIGATVLPRFFSAIAMASRWENGPRLIWFRQFELTCSSPPKAASFSARITHVLCTKPARPPQKTNNRYSVVLSSFLSQLSLNSHVRCRNRKRASVRLRLILARS